MGAWGGEAALSLADCVWITKMDGGCVSWKWRRFLWYSQSLISLK